MKISLLLPSFQRANLLDIGLKSISMQNIDYDLEILVINDGIDDNTKQVCKKYSNLNIKYLFTGQRNKKEIIFRAPVFAFNIGIKQSKGDIIILSNPEIFHIKNTINLLIEPFLSNKNIITTPEVMFDNTGKTKEYLTNYTNQLPKEIEEDLEKNTTRCKYASKLPFCIGLHKHHLIEIGGYDEGLCGWACDDDDIIDRLTLKGLNFYYTEAQVIHLYHDKQYERGNRQHPKFLHNYNIYKEKKNIILRNIEKEWGIND